MQEFWLTWSCEGLVQVMTPAEFVNAVATLRRRASISEHHSPPFTCHIHCFPLFWNVPWSLGEGWVLMKIPWLGLIIHIHFWSLKSLFMESNQLQRSLLTNVESSSICGCKDKYLGSSFDSMTISQNWNVLWPLNISDCYYPVSTPVPPEWSHF